METRFINQNSIHIDSFFSQKGFIQGIFCPIGRQNREVAKQTYDSIIIILPSWNNKQELFWESVNKFLNASPGSYRWYQITI